MDERALRWPSRLGSYVGTWQQRVPEGPFASLLPQGGNPPAASILVPIRNGRDLAEQPRRLWLAARWLLHDRQRALDRVSPRTVAAYTMATGVSAADQRSRLAALAAAGVLPSEAYELDLIATPGAWQHYAFDRDPRWNVARSRPGAYYSIAMLSDKHRSSTLLASAGLPTVPSIDVQLSRSPGRTAAENAATTWLRRWPKVHGKPRAGSRGEGAFELGLEHDDRLYLREHQSPRRVPDPIAWLADHLAGVPYLIQPRLASHEWFTGVAHPSDVVTTRVVTRSTRGEPEHFATCLEVPLAPSKEGQFYVLLAVSDGGRIGAPPLRAWRIRANELDPPSQSPATREANRIETALAGLELPQADMLRDICLRAHHLMPDLFAIAWDVAFTPDGWVILEGNTGFGTMIPQVIAGGLLRVSAFPPRDCD